MLHGCNSRLIMRVWSLETDYSFSQGGSVFMLQTPWRQAGKGGTRKRNSSVLWNMGLKKWSHENNLQVDCGRR